MRYSTISTFTHNDFVVPVKDEQFHNAVAWCGGNIGELSREWRTLTYKDGYITFAFRTEKNAMFFALKWA